MGHIIKLKLRIVMVRARNSIKPEVGRAQCEFVKNTGTRNAISMARMFERVIEMQKDM